MRKRTHKALSAGPGLIPFAVFFVFAVIFTQALRSSVSTVLFFTVILMPIAALIYAAVGAGGITAFVKADETTAQKLTPVPYEFMIINSSLLPLPFIDAEISIPDSDGVRCFDKSVSMSILPHGRYTFSDNIIFKYRGKYEVGVGDVYVYDPLKIFRIRADVGVYYEMYILPRRLTLERETVNAPSDLPTDSNRTVTGIESSETNRIREYRVGDSLKHIHWKLSSKLQDLQVNEYMPNTGKNVYIFCDFARREKNDEQPKKEKPVKIKKKREKRPVKLNIEVNPAIIEKDSEELLAESIENAASRAEAAAALAKQRDELSGKTAGTEMPDDAVKPDDAENDDFPEAENTPEEAEARLTAEEYFAAADDIIPEYYDDMDDFCADGVSEIAVGAVMNELESNNTVTLMWFDERVKSGFRSYKIISYSDLDLIYNQFSTAPFCDNELKVTRLAELIDDVQNPTFIFVTSEADLTNASDFVDVSNKMGAEMTEIMLFNPRGRFVNPELHAEYLEACRQRFAESKITLSETRIHDFDAANDDHTEE